MGLLFVEDQQRKVLSCFYPVLLPYFILEVNKDFAY